MNRGIAAAIGLFCLSMIACSKSPNEDEPPKISLTSFKVDVIERTALSAIIQWDSSINQSGNEIIRYRIYLGNIKLKDSLTRLFDTLYNLEKDRTYSGKVVAFTGTDTLFSEFSISTYDGELYLYSQPIYETIGRFGLFDLYPNRPISNQQPLWRYSLNTVLVPTLSNDTIFLVSGHTLRAVVARTGAMLWQAPANLRFVTSVTYSEGRLYGCSYEGALLCIDSKTGQLLWDYPYPLQHGEFNSVPVVDNGIVFVAPTNWGNAQMHALNAVSGRKIWSYTINSSICKKPLARNGVVVVSSGIEGKALALDGRTGTLLWVNRNFDKIGAEGIDPVYAEGNVLVSTSGTIYALDLKTGIAKWFYGRGPTYHCVVGNGLVYFREESFGANGYLTANLVAVTAKDGNPIWVQHASPSDRGYSNMIFAKDKIYAINEAGVGSKKLMVFNALNGRLDTAFQYYNTVALNRYENVITFVIKRDGIVYYPSKHGNYQ